jgi:hypothetical protein
MDARSENLLTNTSNARNSELSSKIEIGKKGKTFYSERGNYVQSGDKTIECINVWPAQKHRLF